MRLSAGIVLLFSMLLVVSACSQSTPIDAQGEQTITDKADAQRTIAQSARSLNNLTGVCGVIPYLPGAQGYTEGNVRTRVDVLRGALVVGSGESDEDGRFAIPTAPGEYIVREAAYGTAVSATVEAGKCTNVTLVVAAPSRG